MSAKVNFTKHMIDDLKEISYSTFSKKWGVSVPTIIKNVRQYKWDTLTGPDGLIKHRVMDGVECKRCGTCKNWFPAISGNFYSSNNKPDGFMASCKRCQDEKCKVSNSRSSDKFTDEMISDLYKIGDVEFSGKWNVSHNLIIKERKVRCIKSFNNQHGTIEHKFIDGIEHKWCGRCETWKKLEDFYKKKTSRDGIRHTCKVCELENFRNNKVKILERQKRWAKTESGHRSKLLVWRKKRRRDFDAYVHWSHDEDNYILSQFNNKCPYCGSTDELELEHFISISKGGKTEPGNCYYACKNCNRGEGGKFERMPLEWLLDKFSLNGYNIYCVVSEILRKHHIKWKNS